MKTNDVLVKHNFITKILMKDGDAQLSRELKVKIMSARIDYGKIRKQFDEDVKEFTDQLITDDFRALQMKADRTDEEETKVKEMADQINADYAAFVKERSDKDVEVNDVKFTEDEFKQIVETNAGNDVSINGQSLDAGQYLEALYELFVGE